MDVFVTLDSAFFHGKKGAGSRRKDLEEEFKIRIRKPSELLSELGPKAGTR